MKQEEMSVKEAARSKGVSLKRIYDLLAEGRLTGARKEGKVWRIPASSVLGPARTNQHTGFGAV